MLTDPDVEIIRAQTLNPKPYGARSWKWPEVLQPEPAP